MLTNYYHIRYATYSAPSLNNKLESGNWLFHKIHLHARIFLFERIVNAHSNSTSPCYI